MSATKKNTILKDAIILFVIALILSALLGITNEITKDKIAEQKTLRKENAYRAVFPGMDGLSISNTDMLTQLTEASESMLAAADTAAVGEGNTINDILEVKDSSGAVIGYAVDVTNSKGYGGDIEMAVGVLNDGTITGLSIIQNSETAGLGANCTKDSWREQFAGISYPVTFTKTGETGENMVDAISSATYTTKAVTWGVNAALYVIQGGID